MKTKLMLTMVGLCVFSGVAEEYRIPADFRGDTPPRRANRDIAFPCDLTRAEGLSFDFKAEDLSEFSSFSFYFDFGGGVWCGAAFHPVVENEWVQMTVKRPEDKDGKFDWSKVRGFRLSGWCGGTNSTFLAVKDIAVEPVRAEKKPTEAEKASREAAWAAKNAAALARLRAVPPKPGERRLVWAHNPNGFRGLGWEAGARLLAENGFTDLIANLAHGTMAAYPSDVLGFSPIVGGTNRLEECLAACRRHGVKLHVWNVCWGTGWGLDETTRKRFEAEGRMQRSFEGRPNKWLCPTHSENRKILVDAMLELAAKGVDGVHFDYIRYPDSDYCFCDNCRRLFEKANGGPVADWPGDVRRDPRLMVLWRKFRTAAITAPVKAVSARLRKMGSKAEVSAAVFRDPLSDPDYVGQDWANWCEKGYLDFVCPMTYEDDFGWFKRKLDKEARQVRGTVPRYPGIGLGVWKRDGLERVRFADQVRYVRETGLRGFTVFDLGWKFEQLMPCVRNAMLAPPEDVK